MAQPVETMRRLALYAACLAIGLTVAGLVPLVPAASAGTPTCSAVTDGDAAQVGPLYAPSDDESLDVWGEENGLDGLQTEACRTSEGPVQPADASLSETVFTTCRDVVATVNETPASQATSQLPVPVCDQDLSTCDSVEDDVQATPAGQAWNLLPGSVCQFVRNWMGLVDDLVEDGPPLPDEPPDPIETCNEIVASIPVGPPLQCL